MLIIWHPDTMLTELRNTKVSRQLSAVWTDSVHQNVSESYVSMLHSSALG